jgi:hypothetical protein
MEIQSMLFKNNRPHIIVYEDGTTVPIGGLAPTPTKAPRPQIAVNSQPRKFRRSQTNAFTDDVRALLQENPKGLTGAQIKRRVKKSLIKDFAPNYAQIKVRESARWPDPPWVKVDDRYYFNDQFKGTET